MTSLFDVNERNWQDVARLTVRDDQRAWLDSALGIVARGYAYRACRAKVIGIADGTQIIGVALVRDLDEEPACYDLQQFLIDARFQGRGHGTEALELILSRLRQERKYDCVEVCIDRANAAALRMVEKAGFIDTGYVDESVPHCLNLICRFAPALPCSDVLISDFTHPQFQTAFRQYFDELGMTVSDWDQLFRDMNADGGNLAWLRLSEAGEPVGFLQFKPISFTSWFFEETCGFIRELWVAEPHRGSGHGAALLSRAEAYFRDHGLSIAILTTDTAQVFYRRHGYVPAPGCRARNGDEVFVKKLTGSC